MPPIDIQDKKFAAPGRCIYCGSDGHGCRLRDEHIMPFSLGGNAILQEASCKNCEGVTSYVDGYLSRGVFYDYRLHKGVQSRSRSKDRPTTRTTIIRRKGREEAHKFNVGDHPYTVVLPTLGIPSAMKRLPRASAFSSSKALMFYYFPPDLAERLGLDPGEVAQIVPRGTLNLSAFARGIAKIGYCHAVAQGHVTPSPSLPIVRFILGLEDFGPHLVGSDPGSDEAQGARTGYIP